MIDDFSKEQRGSIVSQRASKQASLAEEEEGEEKRGMETFFPISFPPFFHINLFQNSD